MEEQTEVTPPRVRTEGQQMNGIIEDRSSVSSTDMLVRDRSSFSYYNKSIGKQSGNNYLCHLLLIGCFASILHRVVLVIYGQEDPSIHHK